MAGRVQQGTQAPEYAPGKPNQVLAVAPVTMLAVKFTNGEGRIGACLSISFGTDTEDGGPGVYIMAEQVQMTEQLTVAGPVVRDGVRRHLASQKPVSADNIPASVLALAGDDSDITKTTVG
jgi:hypothetical protein